LEAAPSRRHCARAALHTGRHENRWTDDRERQKLYLARSLAKRCIDSRVSQVHSTRHVTDA